MVHSQNHQQSQLTFVLSSCNSFQSTFVFFVICLKQLDSNWITIKNKIEQIKTIDKSIEHINKKIQFREKRAKLAPTGSSQKPKMHVQHEHTKKTGRKGERMHLVVFHHQTP